MKDDMMIELEKKRKKFLIFLLIWLIVSVVSVAYLLGMFGLTFIQKFQTNYLLIGIVLMIVAIFLVLIVVSVKYFDKKLKKVLIAKVSQQLNLRCQYDDSAGIPEEIFKLTNFIKKYDRYTAFDNLSGYLKDDIRFSVCNAIVTEKREDNQGGYYDYFLFEGVFGMQDANEGHDFDINIVPDVKNKYMNQIVTNFKKMIGVKNIIRLENSEFERYFEVYSEDPIGARKMITAKFMEELLKARKELGASIYIMYIKKTVFFFIPNVSILKARFILFTGVTQKLIDKNVKNIKLLLNTLNNL